MSVLNTNWVGSLWPYKTKHFWSGKVRRNQRPDPSELLAQLKPDNNKPFWRTRSARLSIVALLMVLLITSLKGQWQTGKTKLKQSPLQKELQALKQATLKNSDQYFARAQIFTEHAHFSEAIADYNQILKENPRSLKALTLRAENWSHLGKYTQAQQDWNSILNYYPSDLTALNQRGVTFLKQGKMLSARQDFDKAISKHPNEAVLWANRGLSWLEEKQYALAQTDLKKALGLNPKLPESHYYWGRLQLAQANPSEAFKAFDNTLILRSDFAPARFERAKLLNAKGVCKLALKDFKAACRLGLEQACKPPKCKEQNPKHEK
jgi:tetratricopeptide (TPR) repeat protein